MEGAYLSCSQEKFNKISTQLQEVLENCTLCGQKCGVNRAENEKGRCRAGKKIKFSSAFSHFGEEKPLVGTRGSGTIFLSNCNLSCVYCQNYELSQLGEGREVTPAFISEKMLNLQESGCHNINWVSPTHYLPQLIKSLQEAKGNGLTVPIVYNTGGYDNPQILRSLDGLIDIYLTDAKYGSNKEAKKYSNAFNYWKINKKSIKEMHRQVGDLKTSENGIAKQGLVVRHLVLPEKIAQSENIIKFLAEEVSRETYLNIMKQYRPCWKARDYEELARPIRREEYLQAVKIAERFGLTRGLENTSSDPPIF